MVFEVCSPTHGVDVALIVATKSSLSEPESRIIDWISGWMWLQQDPSGAQTKAEEAWQWACGINLHLPDRSV